MVLRALSLLAELAEEEYPPEILAAIDADIDDIDAGRSDDIEIVFARLQQRFATPDKTSAA